MSLINLLRKSMARNGKLIIVHREPSINTLPLPNEVLEKWFNEGVNRAGGLIKQLTSEKNNNVEVNHEVEIIKFVINKLNWFSLLYNRAFYPLTLTYQAQVKLKNFS
jgi:hypothetical protein